MKCQEFEQIWNELLDVETSGQIGAADELAAAETALARREREAHEHALACARCGPARLKYETLRRSLRAWNSRAEKAPAPSPELVARILAESGLAREERAWYRRGALVFGPAVAAALLALLFLPVPWRLDPPGRQPRGRSNDRVTGTLQQGAAKGAPDAQVLREALADATMATWDLARTTSEPAARLGREVLGATTQPPDQAGADSWVTAATPFNLVSLASVLRSDAQSFPGAALLQDLGDGLAASVRPLSSSARQAFGFLRTPNVEKRNQPGTSPASKGA
jgi:hypothetical protein